MTLNERITAFVKLGDKINGQPIELMEAMQKAKANNSWFTIENCEHALSSISKNLLVKDKLDSWISNYPEIGPSNDMSIGLIMAGNIPLVGFHDLLCVLIAGFKVKVKLSSKDKQLLPLITNWLAEIEPKFKNRITYIDILKGFDGIIATGGNNASRYFDYYFGKYPHIIRRNRTSVAILDGSESSEELQGLGSDIFSYFGLGCRSISKIYVPEKYDLTQLFRAFEPFRFVSKHNAYQNNYDYNRTLFIMNKDKHFANEYFSLKESKDLVSPISSVFYQHYKSDSELNNLIESQLDNIQCVVGKKKEWVDFGQTQSPGLSDYADHVDTLKFLIELKNTAN